MSNIERRHSVNFKRYLTNYFRLTALEDNVTFTVNKGNNVRTTDLLYLEYSINEGKNWTRVINENNTITITIPNIRLGDSVIFRGSGTRMSSNNANSTQRTCFNADKKYKASGVLMTLLKGRTADANTLMGTAWFTFSCLFIASTTLVDAENLIFAPNVSAYCYRQLFDACSSLQKAPLVLPSESTMTQCYHTMFRNCTSLTTAPVILATDLAALSCSYMFLNCTSLISAPSLSSVVTLSGSQCCLGMFENCTSLVNVPSTLKPMTLTSRCYEAMFISCTSITTSPNLPATTLASSCYRNMFNTCSSLITGPLIKALTLTELACHSMFNKCYALRYIELLATDISANLCLYTWMPSSVMTNLEFHRNPEATWWVVGAYGIPLESTLFDGTEDTDEEVTFIDPEVNRIVLATWGNRIPGNTYLHMNGRKNYTFTDGVRIGGIDGKILKRQVEAVVSIQNLFTENSTIVNLSDLTKFTGLKYIGIPTETIYNTPKIGFYNCTSLKYINLPNSLLNLAGGYVYGYGCFRNTAIESIYIPDGVTLSCDCLFLDCAQLETVRWSSNLPIKVNNYALFSSIFRNCSNLETIENYPSTGDIIPANNWANCVKLDISLFYPLLLSATTILGTCIKNTDVSNLPEDLVFYNCTSFENYAFSGIGRRRLFLPRAASILLNSFAENNASLIDLGNVTDSYFYPGNGNSAANTVTVILRSTATPTFSTFNVNNVRRIYVYLDILSDFISTYSLASSITYAIGGTEWTLEFGSTNEWADYPNGVSPFNN